MGIFKVGVGAFKSVLSDQWREYFYCPSMPSDVLATKGVKRKTKLSFNKGSDNLITNGSVIAVNEGQCMMIVDQGAIVEVCAEAGEFVYDASSEPSIFTGNLSDEIVKSFEQFMKRVSMGGDTGKDQRIYYIFDPILFYKNICGNFEGDFRREKIDPQLKSEMMTALQPAFAMMAFAGMNMAANAGGINASQLFQMANQQQMYQQPAPQIQPQPIAGSAAKTGWICSCGTQNKGKFCMECGKKKPAGALLYKCDKCGWEPEDPKNPPKFCPECGDPFNDEDAKA